MSKYLALIIILFSVAACMPQPPRYQLTAPTTLEGQQCAQRCDAASNLCTQQCNATQAACRLKAERQAKLELPARLELWDREIAAWERRVQRYEIELSFYEMRRQHWHIMRDLARPNCRRGDRDCHPVRPRFRDDWLDRPLSPGPAPKRPSLESETNRIQALTCPSDCACAAQFRQCFVTCGGGVKPY